MLKVEKVHSYDQAKFPSGKFIKHNSHPFIKYAKSGGSLVLLSSLLQGCLPIGVAGNEQETEYISEAEAREAINRVFSDNNISLVADFPMELVVDDSTITAYLDGYNEELKIGYEYSQHVYDEGDEHTEFWDSFILRSHFEVANEEGTYHVTVQQRRIDKEGNLEELENAVQEFIDSIMSDGII